MCGIVGIFGIPDAARLVGEGLQFLQKRGEDGFGIVSSDGADLHGYHELGLVSNADRKALKELPGTLALGHVRYPTTGKTSSRQNLQPLVAVNHRLAIVHNGEIVNQKELRDQLQKEGAIFSTTSDTEVILHLLARTEHSLPLHQRVVEALKPVKGAYSLLVMSPEELVAVRDPHGIRPLVYGRRGEVVIFASEDAPFGYLQVQRGGDVQPGEIFVARKNGSFARFQTYPRALPSHCSLEPVYFARPDSTINGQSVWEARVALGKALAKACPPADLVLPVMDSGLHAAQGFSQASKIPLELALVRDHYAGRSFIQATDAERKGVVRRKLRPIASALRGKRVALVDDSLVRGNTMRELITTLREAEPAWIGVFISFPPVSHSCYYGIDTPQEKDLAYVKHGGRREVRKFIGANYLHYLDTKEFLDTLTNLNGSGTHRHERPPFCTACFTGVYPAGRPE